MNPRPFYRSRLFWLGLPGLVFLLWGWLNEPSRWSEIRPTLGDYRLRIADQGRRVHLVAEVFKRRRLTAPGVSFHTGSGLAPNFQSLFPGLIRCSVEGNPAFFGVSVGVAYWFLILLYLGAFGSAYFWWQRCKARLIKLHSLP